MLDWLRNWRGRGRDDAAAAHPPERDSAAEHARFNLEALEPRLLLSADPVLSELARWATEDDAAREQGELAVIYEELDAATEAALVSALATGSGEEANSSTPLVIEWPGADSDAGGGDWDFGRRGLSSQRRYATSL